MSRRGILGHGAYLPHRRLDRTTIAAVAGTGGGKGTRTVAGFDEDTTTLGVEAARLALRSTPGVAVRSLLFSTVEPAYADKTNATAVHAALRLPAEVPALDVNGAVRSGSGALRRGTDPGRRQRHPHRAAGFGRRGRGRRRSLRGADR
jgi:3-hydroxy-3-methylglutaryl CoA synthase